MLGGEELSDVSEDVDDCHSNQIFVEISLLHDYDRPVTGDWRVLAGQVFISASKMSDQARCQRGGRK